MPESVQGYLNLQLCKTGSKEPRRENWTREAATRRLQEIRASPGSLGVVAVDGGGLMVGFLLGARETTARGEVFCTQRVCVRPDAEQRGRVGGALLEELDRTLRTLGVRSSYLLTIRDRGLETFYERRGYRRNPRHVWMERRIL